MSGNRLDGKIAIVTGGAQGIGEAIVATFLREGARVIISDINEAAGQATAETAGANAEFMQHDVASEDDWRRVMGETVTQYGGLDILVNNAAITGDGVGGQDGPVADPENTTIENWRAIHRVNADGPFLGCKHAIPAMRDSGGGSIVNISSGGALIPSPMNTPYGAAKSGLRNLTITVAIHCGLKGYNIRCNAVFPGATRTAMLEGLFEVLADESGVTAEDIATEWGKQSPLGRLAEPEDIANAVLFLASDESSYITAEELVVDGGSRYPTFLSEDH